MNFVTILSSLSSETPVNEAPLSTRTTGDSTELQDSGVEEVEEIVTVRDAGLQQVPGAGRGEEVVVRVPALVLEGHQVGRSQPGVESGELEGRLFDHKLPDEGGQARQDPGKTAQLLLSEIFPLDPLHTAPVLPHRQQLQDVQEELVLEISRREPRLLIEAGHGQGGEQSPLVPHGGDQGGDGVGQVRGGGGRREGAVNTRGRGLRPDNFLSSLSQ